MTNTATSKSKSPAPSRKSKVKALFEAQGVEAAHTLGLKLKLKPSTLRTWCATWRREGVKPTPKAKVASKPKAASKLKAKVEAKKNGNGQTAAVTA
jgi:hypothetical protein